MRNNPHRKGSYTHRGKFYSPPLPSTYKETQILEDLNDGMEWVFRDYGRSLNKSKAPLQPRYDVDEFYVQTNTKELDKNLKLQEYLIELK